MSVRHGRVVAGAAFFVAFAAMFAVSLAHAQSTTPTGPTTPITPNLSDIEGQIQDLLKNCSVGSPAGAGVCPGTQGILDELQSFTSEVGSLGSLSSGSISIFTSSSTSGSAGVDKIRGLQGYNPADQQYIDNAALVNTFLVLYGTFAPSGNVVSIDALPATTTYQSISQINIPLTGIAPGNHVVFISSAPGAVSASAPFLVSASVTIGTGIVSSPGPGLTSGVASSSINFPATILVTASALHVRSSPTMTAPLAGSQTLYAGDTFIAMNEVEGEDIGGNDLWWVSSKGNYIWSGGTTASAEGSSGSPHLGPRVLNPSARVSLSGPVTKTVTSGGVSYSVTYSYLDDGEVRAIFTYKGKTYAVQNYSVFGTYGGVAQVEANGGFGFPWTGQADLTLTQLANQIQTNAPANQTVYTGFTFATPLYYLADVSPYYIDPPADAYGVQKSTYSNVPTNLYKLDVDADGNLVGVIPVNIATSGSITIGQEIMISTGKNFTSGILGGKMPVDYLSSLISDLESQGYQVSQSTNGDGTITGMASKNGQRALSFTLGDDSVGAMVSGYTPDDDVKSCFAQTPEGVPIHTEIISDGGTTGFIPHISNDFNVLVDQSLVDVVSASRTDSSDSNPEELTSDITQQFLQSYSPYTQVTGLPQPTETADANTVVILAGAENLSLSTNGSIAQTVTILPDKASSGGTFIPPGSADAVEKALNAGKQVVLIVYDTQVFSNYSFSCVTEHEMGHTLGLDDDYANPNSPMRGGEYCLQNGTTLDGNPIPPGEPISISPFIADHLTAIQNNQSFLLDSCEPQPPNYALPSSSRITAPDYGQFTWLNGTYIPVRRVPGTNQWAISDVCSDEQVANGAYNIPGLQPGCYAPAISNTQLPSVISSEDCTSAQIAQGNRSMSAGCYQPTPKSDTSISFGEFPDQAGNTATCTNNFGTEYACAFNNCGGLGQLECPVNRKCQDSNGNAMTCPVYVSEGECLDENGSSVACPVSYDGIDVSGASASTPTDENQYSCVDNACAYVGTGGMYSDSTCNDVCNDQ